MAAEGQVEEFCSESARLREEIVRLISRRIEESIPKKSKCLKIAKVLSKRKRKWRKKQNLEAIKPGYRPVDHHLRQEKETIEDTQIGLKDALFRRRQEAFGIARQQEKEKGEYHLEAISHRLQVAHDEFKASLLSQQNVVPPSEPREPSIEQPDQLIAEMQLALEQASMLRRIRQMKHTMTPRFPPLHNRTLTGNILDASLGLMNTPQLPHPPTHVNRDIATTLPVVSVPMETTTVTEDSTSRDQKPELERDQRSTVEGSSGGSDNKEIIQSTTKSSGVQGSPEEQSKTYGNVRLSTDPVPLRLSSSDESLPPVISPNNIMTSVSAAGALPPAILMKDDVGTNAERFSVISSPSLQLSNAATTITVNNHSLPISSHLLPMDMSVVEDSPFEATPLPLSTISNVLDESSPLPQRDLNATYVKSSPTTSVGEIADSCQEATRTTTCQQDETRTRNEHSYAMVEPHNGSSSDERPPPQNKESSQVNEDQTSRGIPPQAVPNQEQHIISEAGTMQEGILLANEEQNLNTKEQIYVTGGSSQEGGDDSQSLVVEERLDGYVDQSSVIMDLVKGGDSRMSFDNLVPVPEGAMEVLHEPVDLLPTVIEDQVLEVAVIEPKSDVPMPVEYTVVTQQDEPPPPSPPQQEEKSAEDDVPIQNPDADMVLEDGNESGESITIGCEVTASTMELTDVTDFSGGSSTATTMERPRVPDVALAEDISCETVIITTSAMNSLSAGYNTPSGEESDGTISSVEEKQRRRGEGERERGEEEGGGETERVMIADGGERQKKNSEIVANHEDGTESDEIFEDILKQIESAPYELRISNIVLAQLSRAVSKSPPNTGKKRKRRSASKKWTRTKSRKSNTPRKK